MDLKITDFKLKLLLENLYLTVQIKTLDTTERWRKDRKADIFIKLQENRLDMFVPLWHAKHTGIYIMQNTVVVGMDMVAGEKNYKWRFREENMKKEKIAS